MELTISHISPGFHVYLHLVNSCLKFWRLNSDGEQGIAQWWEHSPPTDVVRVQIPASTPYVGSVCCWFSPSERFFSGYSGFPLSSNKTTTSKFQFDQKSGRRRTTLWICYPQNHYLFILFIYQMLLLLSTKDTERLGFTTVTLCLGK